MGKNPYLKELYDVVDLISATYKQQQPVEEEVQVVEEKKYAPHQVAYGCVEKPCFDDHGCEVRGSCQTYELLKDTGIYD